MKQANRFFLHPGVFFNQLQWSTHHWLILLAFGVVAFVEPLLGPTNTLTHYYAYILEAKLGMGHDFALATVMAGKIGLMMVGLYAFSALIWFVGNLLGRRESSQRVLLRRLAVVFTVLLFGYSMHHLIPLTPEMAYVTLGFYIWGGFLGFLALKEQFELNVFEAAILSIFSIVVLAGTWKYGAESAKDYAHYLAISQSSDKTNSLD